MVHRAGRQRNTATGSDGFGQPVAPTWATAVVLPCRAWNARRDPVRDGEKVVRTQEIRAAFPLGADIIEGDRLESITDRRGTVLFAGPLFVETIVSQPTHREVVLERL